MKKYLFLVLLLIFAPFSLSAAGNVQGSFQYSSNPYGPSGGVTNSNILGEVSQSIKKSKTEIVKVIQAFKWIIAIMVFGVIAYSGFKGYYDFKRKSEEKRMYSGHSAYLSFSDLTTHVLLNVGVTTLILYIVLGMFALSFAGPPNGGGASSAFSEAWKGLVTEFWKNAL